MNDETFRWVVAGGVILAALSFLVMGIVAVLLASLIMKVKAKLDPILESLNPIMRTAKETAVELKPKISKISDGAVETSKLVVAEVHRYSGVSKDFAEKATDVADVVVREVHRYSDISRDVADRVKVRIADIDQAVDHTVDQVQDATGAVKSAVMLPFRTVEGVAAGVAAAVSTYVRGRKSSVSSATQDEEMFI